LWPRLVYNLNNKEQVTTQRVLIFAPTDPTTKFLDECLDEKVPSRDLHLSYNCPYKHDQDQN
jgi:hypothetical protein